MAINNKMGGFISAQIISADQIDNFYFKERRAYIDAPPGAYQIIDAVKNGIDVSISPSSETHGLVYDFSATVTLKDDFGIDIIPFNRTLLLAKTATGQTWVFGSPNFPLRMVLAPSFSSSPSGRNSLVLNFTGKSPNAPAVLAL